MLQQLSLELRQFSVCIDTLVPFNNKLVRLLRYEKNNNITRGFGGEHISLLLDNTMLLGFARMTRDYRFTDKELFSKSNAYQQAMQFLQQAAPDLVTEKPPCWDNLVKHKFPQALSHELDIHWIDLHSDEIITIDNSKNCLGGMKVKMRLKNTSNQWAWVIVNQAGLPCVFERNICWNMVDKQRETEKWLHDYEKPLSTDSSNIVMNKTNYNHLISSNLSESLCDREMLFI